MNYTPNLNLKKPAKTDPVLIDDLNDNMDILDQEVKDVRDILVNVPTLSPSANLFDKEDPDILIGKGFSGSTGTIVDADPYNITGFIPMGSGELILLGSGGVAVSLPNFHKIVAYNNQGSWISTQTYTSGGITTPANTAYIRVQWDAAISVNTFQVNAGSLKEYQSFYYTFDQKVRILNVKQGLKWVSYGDSIISGNQWQPHVSDYFRLNHTPQGIGSTTVALIPEREAEFPSFTNQSRIDAIINANPSLVTILGGTNDTHLQTPIGTDAEFLKVLTEKDKTNFKGAYSWLIETLLTWKPTLEIILLTPMQTRYDGSYTTPYKSYAEATKGVALHYALPVIDTYTESGIRKFTEQQGAYTYTRDGIHPNALGGKRIANLVIDKIIQIMGR